jgi:hypothetical protein
LWLAHGHTGYRLLAVRTLYASGHLPNHARMWLVCGHIVHGVHWLAVQTASG